MKERYACNVKLEKEKGAYFPPDTLPWHRELYRTKQAPSMCIWRERQNTWHWLCYFLLRTSVKKRWGENYHTWLMPNIGMQWSNHYVITTSSFIPISLPLQLSAVPEVAPCHDVRQQEYPPPIRKTSALMFLGVLVSSPSGTLYCNGETATSGPCEPTIHFPTAGSYRRNAKNTKKHACCLYHRSMIFFHLQWKKLSKPQTRKNATSSIFTGLLNTQN